LTSSIKEVGSEKECLERLESASIMQKALRICLGILSVAPGTSELVRKIPIGSKEGIAGLLALQTRNPALGILALSMPHAVMAQVPVGAEFQINTYTVDDQAESSVVGLGDGGFVVAWMSGSVVSPSGQDGSYSGVFGQRYNVVGAPIGSEFRINNYTSSSQAYPSLSGLTNGGFIVTWLSSGQDGDAAGVFGQHFAQNGATVAEEFQVNTYTANSQSNPKVSGLNDGGFVAVWNSEDQVQFGMFEVFGQRYDANGAVYGAEFQVNNYTNFEQANPSVASLNDGGYVVVWQSAGQDEQFSNTFGIYGQRYDANNALVAGEFQVNTYNISNQQNPSIAGLANGGYVVVWQSSDQDGSGWGIYGQRYDLLGNTSGGEFQVNTNTNWNQQNPVIAALSDGGFVVIWTSRLSVTNEYGIFGQRYSASGEPVGGEFLASSTLMPDLFPHPSVGALMDGGFVVTWNRPGDGDGAGVFGQRFSAELPTPTPTPTPTPSSTPTPTTASTQNPSPPALSSASSNSRFSWVYAMLGIGGVRR